MEQDARDLQNESVKRLVDLVKSSTQKEITFKAPTGAGKTYMMADFMNRMLSYSAGENATSDGGDVNNQKYIFLVSTLSKAGLAKQNYDKFTEYASGNVFGGEQSYLNPYLINTQSEGEARLQIPAEYNVYVLPVALNKKGGLLIQNGALKNFLNTMKGNNLLFDENSNTKKITTVSNKIILIRDECHIATNNLDNLSDVYFDMIINFSATPNLKRGQIADIEITEGNAIAAHLIKDVKWQEDKDTPQETLDYALTLFEQKKPEFQKIGINPAFIIQISNKSKADEEVAAILDDGKIRNHHDLSWMLVVDDPKKCDTDDIMKAKKLPQSQWKEYLKQNDSTIDVVIFKMVITEGYDMPRAFMLYQVRDTKSKQLDEQVIGRVRRNPHLMDFESLNESERELCTTAYVWGIRSKEMKVQSVRLKDKSVQNAIKVQTTRLKPLTQKVDFSMEKLLAGKTPVADILDKKTFFALAAKFFGADGDVQKLILEYAHNDTQRWVFAMYYFNDIVSANQKYKCDYSESMEVAEPAASFPLTSYTITQDNYTPLGNWIWQKTSREADRDADDFSFDSVAERKWAKRLNDLEEEFIKKADELPGIEDSLFEWGKNYPANSQIRFEYYTDASHFSYPDFVMQDRYGRIHIFEVKSLQVSKKQNIDEGEYKAKVSELGKLYKRASELTKQFFYIPILSQETDTWQIKMFSDGKEDTLSLEGFKDLLKQNNR